jgi:hypothetical protein
LFTPSPAFLLFRYDDGGQDAKKFLQTLEESLKWEVRSLYVVLLGVTVRALSTMVDDPESRVRVERMGYQLLEYAVLWIMIMDASFSIIITAIFIRPIAETLGDAGKVKTKSAGFKDLEKTMYMTLIGSTIAVLSSSILYVNLLMFFNGDYTIFSDNAFLNPLVFMGNIDSILNSMGMLLVSGIFKYLVPSLATKARNLGSATSKGGLNQFRLSIGVSKIAAGNSSAAGSQQYVWNSKAYDEDDSDDDKGAEVAGESTAVPGYRLPPLQHSGSLSQNTVPSSHFTNTSDKIGTYKNVEKHELDGVVSRVAPIHQPSSHFKNVSDKVGTYKNVEKLELDGGLPPLAPIHQSSSC